MLILLPEAPPSAFVLKINIARSSPRLPIVGVGVMSSVIFPGQEYWRLPDKGKITAEATADCNLRHVIVTKLVQNLLCHNFLKGF